ncbi:butyrate kinase [Erysipelothrix sp. HDW6A]|uniref:butyrate kinase n=1 Tax=Erysipelothrix sp. HDW6A TaxID=2714928 RepID=UPI00140CE871|nr:butyrate kinase [Erysipelothrix sp. HDW6A]QIK57756.1 butyrate kinase [Erysipelothrix sp. HDW6A]
MKNKILVINLGGTSSKVAVYDDEQLVLEKTIRHSKQEMDDAPTNKEQVIYRTSMILDWLEENHINVEDITSMALRGGNIPREMSEHGGTYLIDDFLKEEIMKRYNPDALFHHGVIVSPHVATALSGSRKIPLYVTDPPTVNEIAKVARIAGHPLFERQAIAHILNQRSVARKVAHELNKDYQDSRIIVVHLGAGISVGVHQDGMIVDINNCTRGDGPMSPERSGQLPMGQLVELALTGDYTKEQIELMLRGNGGVKAYLGTSDMREVEQMIDNGDEKAELVWNALIYQVAKEIGSAYAVLGGDVDCIAYTGGIAHSQRVINALNERVGSFAPSLVFPGEFENEGLAYGALRVIRGEEEIANYTDIDR